MPTTPAAPVDLPDRTPVRKLEFVEVGTGQPIGEGRPARRRSTPPVAEPVGSARSAAVTDDRAGTTKLQPGPDESRWSLWSDGEV